MGNSKRGSPINRDGCLDKSNVGHEMLRPLFFVILNSLWLESSTMKSRREKAKIRKEIGSGSVLYKDNLQHKITGQYSVWLEWRSFQRRHKTECVRPPLESFKKGETTILSYFPICLLSLHYRLQTEMSLHKYRFVFSASSLFDRKWFRHLWKSSKICLVYGKGETFYKITIKRIKKKLPDKYSLTL